MGKLSNQRHKVAEWKKQENKTRKKKKKKQDPSICNMLEIHFVSRNTQTKSDWKEKVIPCKCKC